MYKQKIFLIGFLFFSVQCFAQDSLLTIKGAVESAFDRNAELQQLYAQLKQKENLWRTETGISSPEISYFKEGIASGPGDVFDERRITISQEIDFPLTTSYRLKALAEEVKSLELQINSRENEIKAEVKSYYVEVLYALYLQNSMQNQLKLAQELYNAVYTKFETGMGNGIDLANAELRLEEAKNDLDQTQWILHKARYGLFYAMGLPVEDQKYSVGFSDTLRASDIEISQIMTLAVQEKQPDFLATEHQLQAADFYIKEAKSNILPDIRLNLYKQDYGSGYNFKGFEVGLRIPIWYPLEQKGKINTALARQDEIRWKQQEIRLNTKKQIEYAWHNYSVSRSIIKRYNETMKEKASLLQSLTLKAYQLGEVDLLNLLNAQQTYLASEQRYLTALRDYYLQLVSLEKYLEEDLVY
ncbi:TolC family protein [Maribellus maritimus]|uniref:TolC family protein n=1 Tax=Maribellus maritimus TaxID=2870838 RepID=UPI001EE9DCC5|nr:TolC family protein [Maribellus maritimus]MCG6188812.1 TolC family protein [Maribellus maritimus]